MCNYEVRAKETGARIRKERKARGLSAEDFLDKIYMSRNSTKTLRNWETGVRLPDLESLARMAGVFDCDIGYLLCDYDDRKWVNANVQKETGLSLDTVNKIIALKRCSDITNPQYNIYAPVLEGLDIFFSNRWCFDILEGIAKLSALSQTIKYVDDEIWHLEGEVSFSGNNYEGFTDEYAERVNECLATQDSVQECKRERNNSEFATSKSFTLLLDDICTQSELPIRIRHKIF